MYGGYRAAGVASACSAGVRAEGGAGLSAASRSCTAVRRGADAHVLRRRALRPAGPGGRPGGVRRAEGEGDQERPPRYGLRAGAPRARATRRAASAARSPVLGARDCGRACETCVSHMQPAGHKHAAVSPLDGGAWLPCRALRCRATSLARARTQTGPSTCRTRAPRLAAGASACMPVCSCAHCHAIRAAGA